MFPTPHKPHGLPPAQISCAIDLARITLVVGLVFLHYGTFPNSHVDAGQGLDPQIHPFATWANSTILFIFYSAVPLMSMISGWLFFSFADQDARKVLPHRMRRRLQSLYLPLVVWNAAVLAVTAAAFTLKPDALNFDDLKINLATAGVKDYLNAVFGLTQAPIAFQFWFVRDLFVTALVSPLLWVMLRFFPWVGGALLFTAWLFNAPSLIFLRLDVPCFFYLGALVYRQELSVAIPKRWMIVFTGGFIVLAGLRALAPYVLDPGTAVMPLWLIIATHLMRVVGVVGVWAVMYRAAVTSWGAAIAAYSSLAFFLHSAHWPLLSVLKKVLWQLVPVTTDAGMLAQYGVAVLLTTAICLGSGLLLARLFPQLFALMNGGRLVGQAPRLRQQTQAAREII
jgi:hypothetical protein